MVKFFIETFAVRCEKEFFAIEYSILLCYATSNSERKFDEIWNLIAGWNKRGKYPIFEWIHGSGVFWAAFFSLVFLIHDCLQNILKLQKDFNTVYRWFVCIYFCLLGKNSSANGRTITKTHATMQVILFSCNGFVFIFLWWFWYGTIYKREWRQQGKCWRWPLYVYTYYSLVYRLFDRSKTSKINRILYNNNSLINEGRFYAKINIEFFFFFFSFFWFHSVYSN